MNLSEMIRLICTKGPETVYKELLSSDEGFKGFIEENKNKTREEMIREYNINTILF